MAILKTEEKKFDSLGGQAQQFSVDTEDTMIIRLLRDKMYKNKIGAVCREVSSNSRDANREAGRGDTPITIEINQGAGDILSEDETYITFQDSGIGITPDRMERIFLKYGGSTKRDSDAYTGGFGIGAKTPFAYTDNFFITTVAEVDGKRMKFYYQAAITSDGNREVSQMVSLGEEETTDKTGTNISVPINQDDSRHFMKEVLFATSFWEVQPILKGFNIEYKLETVHEGKSNFRIIKDDSKLYGDMTYFIALIDEIPYMLDLNQLKNAQGMITKDMQNSARHGGKYNNASGFITVFKFNTGDITVSGSREDIEYVENNIKAFMKANQGMKDEVKDLIQKYLKGSTSYYDRCVRANHIQDGGNNYGRGSSSTPDYVKFLGKLAASVGIDRSVIFGTYKGEEVVEKHSFTMHEIDMFSLMNGKMKKGRSLTWEKYGSSSFEMPMYYLNLAKAEPARNARLKLNHGEKGYVLIKEKEVEEGLGIRTDQQKTQLENEKKWLKLIGLSEKWELYTDVEKLKKEKGTNRNITDIVKVSLRYLRNPDNWNKEWTALTPNYDKKAGEFTDLLTTVQGIIPTTTSVAYYEVEKLTDLNGQGYSCPLGMDKDQMMIHSILRLENVLVVACSKSKVQYFKKAEIKSMEETFVEMMKEKAKDDILVKAIDFGYANSNKANPIYFDLNFGKETNAKLLPLKKLLKYAKENKLTMDRYLKIVQGIGEDFADKYKVGVSGSITKSVETLNSLKEKNPLIAFFVEASELNSYRTKSSQIREVNKQLKELFNNQKE